VRQVQTLIPEGVPFPRSQLTVQRVDAWLAEPRVSRSTKRRYFYALRSFAKFLKRRGVLEADPLADMQPPRNLPPRARYMEYPEPGRAARTPGDAGRGRAR
jgi:site-specific recombinase XerD